MKVKIVDEYSPVCFANADMERYSGQILTVSHVYRIPYNMEYSYVSCIEDGGMWNWYMPSIEWIVDNEDDFITASDSDIIELFDI